MAGNRTYYQQALKRGKGFNAREEWKKAVSVIRVAIREFPAEAEPYGVLGEACIGLKQWDRALDCYKRAARYSRGNIGYLNKVADMQERLGQLSEAARTYLAAGELRLRQQNLDDAISNWQRAIRLDATLLRAHRRLAMVYQRQNNVKAAVREYLAIARILEMRGERKKALQMCKAALRLDPDNDDILTAVELIRHGEKALETAAKTAAPEPEPESSTGDSLVDTVRQMAAVLEAERQETQQTRVSTQDPVAIARRLAQENLAAEIFRDEEDEDVLYGTGGRGLSKLERDALIGQGIDYQTRGQVKDAITCYERAIKGGLEISAAFFTLGMLYIDNGQKARAQRALAIAAKDPAYRQATERAVGSV